jgi:hypothetical protein
VSRDNSIAQAHTWVGADQTHSKVRQPREPQGGAGVELAAPGPDAPQIRPKDGTMLSA